METTEMRDNPEPMNEQEFRDVNARSPMFNQCWRGDYNAYLKHATFIRELRQNERK